MAFYMAFRIIKKMDEAVHCAAFRHQETSSIRTTKVAQPESYKHQGQSPCDRVGVRQG